MSTFLRAVKHFKVAFIRDHTLSPSQFCREENPAEMPIREP